MTVTNNWLIKRLCRSALCGMLLLLSGGLSAGCSHALGSVVFGVTSDFRAGVDINMLEVDMIVDGKSIKDQQLALASNDFPTEFAFEEVSDGAQITITLRGYFDGLYPRNDRMHRDIRWLPLQAALESIPE